MEGTTGYLGNLTPDQEARLQQFWMFLLNAFDGLDGKLSSSLATTAETTTRSNSFDEPPLSPNSFDSNGRHSFSSHGNHKLNSNPSVHLPPTPTSPISPSTVQSSLPQPKKLRRRTSLLSNASESLMNRTSSTHKRAMSFHAQSMGGVHLRPSPQNAKVMQRVMNSYKLSPDELRRSLLSSLKQDHPDSMLLRFLRARKWDVGKAFVLLVAAMAWRVKMQVDEDISTRGELYALQQTRANYRAERKVGIDFMKQLRMGKNIIHGVDRAGRPIVDIRVRLHYAEDQSDATLERYIIYTIETVRMLLRPPLVETSVLIFDMNDFSMSNMDYTPIKFIIKCLENFYPESLALILIHNAPWFFSGLWKIIKSWMNDSLVSKVHFTKTVEDLERFIPRENIPADLGGLDAYHYRYIEPDTTDKVESLPLDTYSPTREFLLNQRQRIASDLLDTTRLWLQTSAMRDRIGTAIQQDRRAELIEDLRMNYWRVDPFIRARSQLDREGVIVGDGIGTINIYPHLVARDESILSSSSLTLDDRNHDSGIATDGSANGTDLGFDFGLDDNNNNNNTNNIMHHDDPSAMDVRESFMREYDDSLVSDDKDGDVIMHDEPTSTPQHKHVESGRENPVGHTTLHTDDTDGNDENDEDGSDFDFDDDDEEAEIHDAVTHMVGGHQGQGGFMVQRAAVRVVNVS
ncbi:hypothetical protein BGW36DRAFT_309706 [Talaromyces proteolyticus]|uniref:CRAL-TRIO domain-containing protein n=1 Tax=Talaromyces proteolyticus TaxID=1131652 RepID=A0AAD4PU14_9EURO|nr:uncharacterized protein BGW36DRAFT_309706 [Talaromyces proteolyticus]KAH8688789.1 hypothetical protein BGW36DRAFT_309706 [Talaromyces proteolyticus]